MENMDKSQIISENIREYSGSTQETKKLLDFIEQNKAEIANILRDELSTSDTE